MIEDRLGFDEEKQSSDTNPAEGLKSDVKLDDEHNVRAVVHDPLRDCFRKLLMGDVSAAECFNDFARQNIFRRSSNLVVPENDVIENGQKDSDQGEPEDDDQLEDLISLVKRQKQNLRCNSPR